MAVQGEMQGRVALVLGGGAGVGRAIAEALARTGAAVMVSYVNPTLADAAAAAITAAGGRAAGYPADVGNKFQVAALIEHTRDVFGGLDLVVNAWAVNKRGPALLMDEYDWRRVIEVNLTGAFLVAQLAARVMADEGGGVIVQVGEPSLAEHAAAYRASQAGVAALMAALDAEWAGAGVRVQFVPGANVAEETVRAVLQAVQGEGWR